MIRVAIIDDQDMIRVGLRIILKAQPDIEVVAEAGDGLSGVRLVDHSDVDVVLMDIWMPGIDGVRCAARSDPGRHDVPAFVTPSRRWYSIWKEGNHAQCQSHVDAGGARRGRD